MLSVKLLRYPTEEDWMGVKQRALVTLGKTAVNPPSDEWKVKILRARHSPIRYLQFSFYIECPSWVATHMVRHHVGCQPYVKSQRNDRQSDYDRNAARQDAPVCMILDVNAESMITISNKRLCRQASEETRELVRMMCKEIIDVCPEFKTELVPICQREGRCYEMNPCGRKDVS